jgi:heme/copper-type cytochrome/quinol oxidase subunit 2
VSHSPTPSLNNPTSPRRFGALKIWLVWACLALVVWLAPLPVAHAAPGERHFRIEASSFAYAPATLRVNPGDRVTIDLTSTDVVHGLYIDGYGLEVVSEPGQTQRLSFIADREGSFRMRCNITCGAMHPFMIAKLHVGANELFWKALALAGLSAVAALWSVKR